MNIEFKLPELGEHIESGDVVNVLVEEGQPIAANQGICELETDKAVVEIPCPHAGRVVKIHIHKGDTVHVGQTLVTLDAGSDGKSAEAEATPAEENAPTGQDQAVGSGAANAVSPGGHAGEVSDYGAESRPPTPGPRLPAPDPQIPGGAPVPAGPAARRLARQFGVDLSRLHGSGPGGRITPEDVQAAFPAAGRDGAGRRSAGDFAGAGGAAGRTGPGRLGPGPPR
jgi:pyruvate/2-oxoglutarate dehydrogenase complex dihydrolipoamide acyltransferase (E2) component